jgi:DNA repair protein RecO (recombination protein O)
MINGVKGKKGAIKPSHLLPLSLLELEIYFQQNKNLHRIKELKCTPVLNRVHFEMSKSTVALFMAELLGKCLREESEKDEQLFEFVFHSIQILDLTEDNLSNFPLYFLVHLSKYLGFFPKDNYSEQTPDFSLLEGLFVSDAPKLPDFCKGPMTLALHEFITLNFSEIQKIQLPTLLRRELLSKMIRYYQLHLMMFGDLKSPAILQEVLN